MRNTRLMSAIAIGVAVTISLTGCSEADKAADKAKDKAGEAADSAKAEASKKAKEKADEGKAKLKDKAAEAKAKAKKKAGAGNDKAADGSDEGDGAGDDAGNGDTGNLKVDLGDFADDPSAKAVGAFFEARQAAAKEGGDDLGDLEATATGKTLKKATRYVKKHSGKSSPFVVTVAGVESGSVDVCVGPKGTKARTLTLKGDKVAGNTKGKHTCS